MVIVGAGAAGTAAAMALRAEAWRGPVVLIGGEAMLPYERPPLSKEVLSEVGTAQPPLLTTLERLAELSIDYRSETRAAFIDRTAKVVVLSDGAKVPYERLLLATGARSRVLPIMSTSPPESALTLRSYPDALRLRDSIRTGSSVIVLGGGLVGLEVAASSLARGASVTVLEAGPRLLTRAVPACIADLIRKEHERSGVRIELGVSADRIENDAGRFKVWLTEGDSHLADCVLVAVGCVPNVELAQLAGLAIENGVATAETLQTSDPNIFAAGDCCSFPHRLYGRRIRLEAWRNAQRQGAAAAANMLGANRPYQDVPWFWSDQYGQTLQVAGLWPEEGVQVTKNLGSEGQIVFYMDEGGRLVAACGFGDRRVIGKEIRFAQTMIAERVTPDAAGLADPTLSLRSMLARSSKDMVQDRRFSNT